MMLRSRTWRMARLTALSVTAAVVGLTGLTGVAPPASAAVVASLGYDPVADKGSMWHVAEVVGAHQAQRWGYTGKGIGVALIDTGVTEVPGLNTGNVVHGPDLSFDSQDPELAHRDVYGHGTHLASIIAGRDVAGTPVSYTDENRFNGIAPDATLVSVKVAASDGAVDVSQVIAAIDWVVENRASHNIRVLNLSYGTNSLQDPLVDPLSYAVEQAWKAGIVVVVAGGNDGAEREVLANPALNPNILAVGASDTQGTVGVGDDTVPDWATKGTDRRRVDLVAPGVSVIAPRVHRGFADERNDQARIGTRFARASGTSQSAAVVSGAAALLLQAQPGLTPAQVKAQLMGTADSMRLAVGISGRGLLDVDQAVSEKAGAARDGNSWGTGTGSLEQSRGTSHVFDGTRELTGEVDIFGRTWDAGSWAKSSAGHTAWVGGAWRGATWSGDGFNTNRVWRDVVWGSGTWTGASWRGKEWSLRSWRNGEWTTSTLTSLTGLLWRDQAWTYSSETDLQARTWAARTWAARTWASRTWG